MGKKNGDGFNFSSNASGDGGSNPFSENESEEFEEEHEHVFSEIAQTANLTAYEEMVHQAISIDFQDRGITLEFDYEEIEELEELLAEIVNYIQRKKPVE